MENMEDWIRPAARSLLIDAGYTQDVFSYNDDGSIAAVLSDERKVQLAHFNGARKSPYCGVWVSDSHTKIRANFSTSSTNAFRVTHNRRFYQATLGAILHISACSLSFNPMKKRFTLLIQDFNFCGGEGSQDYGRPVAIEDDSALRRRFMELAKDMKGSKGISSPIRSQAGSSLDALSDRGGDLATHDFFNTQPVHRQSNGADVNGFTLLEPPVVATNQTSGFGHRHASDVSTIKSQDRTVLALLKATSVANVRLLTGNRSSGIKAQTSSPIEFATSFAHSLESLTSNDIGNDTKNHLSKPDSRLMPSSTVCEDDKEIPETAAKSHLKQKNVEISCDESHITEGNASNGSTLALKTAEGESRINSVELSTLVQQKECAGQKCNPWEGLARIPRKYARIPQDQRISLDREDSWYSSRVAQGNNYVNLPPKLIAELGSFYERQSSINLERDEQVREAQSIEDRLSTSLKDDSYEDEYHQIIPEVDQVKQTADQPIERSFQLRDDSLMSSRESSEDADSEDETRVSWPSSPERIEQESRIAQAQRIDSRRSSVAVEHSSADVNLLQASGERLLDSQCLPAALEGQSTSLNEKCANARERESHPFTGAINIPPSSAAEVEEMELVVPYTVDDLIDVLETDDNARSPGASKCFSRVASQPKDRMQVARTPRAVGVDKCLQSPIQTSMLIHALGARNDNWEMSKFFSSSAIIPGTFNDELPARATSPTRPLAAYDLHGNGQYSEDELPSLTTNNLFDASISAQFEVADEDVTADQQIYAECVTYSQREEQRIESGSEINCYSLESDDSQSDIMAVGSNSVPLSPSDASQLSFPDTQRALTTESPRNNAGWKRETSTGSNLQRLKRPAQDMIELNRANHKRRGLFSPCVFGLIQEELPTMNPNDMVKANRRNFVHGQSLQERGSVVATNNVQQCRSSKPNFGPSDQHYTGTSSKLLAIPVQKRPSWLVKDYLIESKSPASLPGNQPVICPGPFIGDSHSNVTNAAGKDLKLVEERLNDSQPTNIENVPAQGATLGYLVAKRAVMDKQEPFTAQVISTQETEQDTKTIFERFNLAYPMYTNNLKSFIRACVYIEWLVDIMSAPHPFLWDDFIRVFSSEFVDYVRECRTSSQKPLSGMKFYNTKIPAPQFTSQIVTPTTIQDALLLDVVESAAIRAAYQRRAATGHPASQPIDASCDASKQAPSSPFMRDIKTKEQSPVLEEQAKSKTSSDIVPSIRKNPWKPLFKKPSQLDAQTHRTCGLSSLPTSPILVEPRRPATIVFSHNSPPVNLNSSPVIETLNGSGIRNSATELPQESQQHSPSVKTLQHTQTFIELKSKVMVDEIVGIKNRRITSPSNSGSIKHQLSPVLGATLEIAPWSLNLSSKSLDQAELIVQAEISNATPTLPRYKVSKKFGSTSGSGSSKSVTTERWRGLNRASTASKRIMAPSDPEHKKLTSYKEAAMAYVPRRNRKSLPNIVSKTSVSMSVKNRGQACRGFQPYT